MATFDPKVWATVPFHFWTLVFFAFGSVVGSFLNVCIYRMPRGESIVSPPSHCPHCNYSIPWYLNIPLFTWLFLRGKCAHCQAPISPRYFVVELLTAVLFSGCWMMHGHTSALLPLAYCMLLGGFVVAAFIDLEHFIIPDEITIGGTAAGFLWAFIVPAMHQTGSRTESLQRSVLGIVVGAGIVYAILRLAKIFFGRQRFTLPPDTRVVFGETGLKLPDREIPYEDIFYRKSDTITLKAKTVQMGERIFEDVSVQLRPDELKINEESFKPEEVKNLEVVTDQITVPREAMGLGDVKFMAAIGAFLGWQGAIFSLMISSVIGALVGVALIVFKRKEWSSRIPYGPYIALAATLWVFGGRSWVAWWFAM